MESLLQNVDAALDYSTPTREILSQSLFPSEVIKEESFSLSRMYKQCLLLCTSQSDTSQSSIFSQKQCNREIKTQNPYTSTGCFFFRFPQPLRVYLSNCEMKTAQHPPFVVRKLMRKSLFSLYARVTDDHSHTATKSH